MIVVKCCIGLKEVGDMRFRRRGGFKRRGRGRRRGGFRRRRGGTRGLRIGYRM